MKDFLQLPVHPQLSEDDAFVSKLLALNQTTATVGQMLDSDSNDSDLD